MCNIIFIFSII